MFSESEDGEAERLREFLRDEGVFKGRAVVLVSLHLTSTVGQVRVMI